MVDDDENSHALTTSEGEEGVHFKRASMRQSVEKRKVINATSFVVDAPAAHLSHNDADNGTTIIVLEKGPLPQEDFPAMSFQIGVGYCEANVASVLLGLDVCRGYQRMTPVAFQHARRVW